MVCMPLELRARQRMQPRPRAVAIFTTAVLTMAILTTCLQPLPQLLLRVHRLGGVGVRERHHARQLAEDQRDALLLGGEEGLGTHHDGQ